MRHPVPDAALDADICTIAQKGAGKTYANRGMVERLLDQRRRVVILDPLNSWWGLKARADGSPGYPVAVIGGPNADVPLDPHAGERMALFVAKSPASFVIDVSELKRGELQRFANDFLAHLYRCNRDPIWLVLEEADVFAPQQPMGDATMLLHQVDQIARRGRARGFRLWSITQRPAKLHKDVLTQTSTLIMLRLRSPQDRAAAEEWIKGNAEGPKAREIVASLASLPVGEGWVWSPDHDLLERVKFPPIRTLDTSATPQAGEARRGPAKLAEVDLTALREVLRPEPNDEPSAKSREKHHDPAQLAAAEERGYRRGLDEGFAEGLLRSKGLFETVRKGASEATAMLHRSLQEASTELERMRPRSSLVPARSTEAAEIVTPRPMPAPKPAPKAGPAGALTGPQQRILDALGWWLAFGITAPTSEQVGFIAGYAPGSGNFNNLRSGLRSAGLIDYPAGGCIGLTAAGLELVAPPDPDQLTTEHFHARVRAKMSGPQLKLLEPVLAAYPGSVSTADLAAAAGYASGSGNFNNLRGSLRSIGLIDYPSPGQVRAATWLFPEV